jgi:threonine dehydrogenase-like Zn-dependent dehydrogenase
LLGSRGRPGALAVPVVLPVPNLHPGPAGVRDEAAAFAEPLAAALEVQAQVAIGPGDRVLVVGAGRLGQLIALTLRASGSEPHVVARHPRQRELLSACGVEQVSEDDVGHAAYDVTIEASGAESGFALARWALRPRGTLVLKSTHHGDRSFDFAQLVVDEITLVGSRCGSFAPALHLLQSGTIDPTPLIDGVRALEEAAEAFVQAAKPGALKILVRPPLL